MGERFFNTDYERNIFVKDCLATSEREAKERYKIYRNLDPYPEKTSALLNSKDIFQYVCTTGMIYPYSDLNLSI